MKVFRKITKFFLLGFLAAIITVAGPFLIQSLINTGKPAISYEFIFTPIDGCPKTKGFVPIVLKVNLVRVECQKQTFFLIKIKRKILDPLQPPCFCFPFRDEFEPKNPQKEFKEKNPKIQKLVFNFTGGSLQDQKIDRGSLPLTLLESKNPRFPPQTPFSPNGGSVLFEFKVTKSGDIEEIVLLEETPEGLGFAQSALKALKKFKFRPRYENGKPVDTRGVKYRFEFVLKEEV